MNGVYERLRKGGNIVVKVDQGYFRRFFLGSVTRNYKGVMKEARFENIISHQYLLLAKKII